MDQRDVRMRGFLHRSDVNEALSWLKSHSILSGIEQKGIQQAFQCVLAEDIIAKINVPSFMRSAMDGFAVKAEETLGASNYNPLRFNVIGESLAGSAFSGTLQPGEAVRIMTGAPVPSSADAVIPVEFTLIQESSIEVTMAVATGKNISQIGEDITAGSVLFSQGRILRAQDIGVLASLGISEVTVQAKPEVQVMITGNELAQPGCQKTDSQIYESNSYMLRGLISRDGGCLSSIDLIADDAISIKQALSDSTADIIIISGGTSVGVEDFAPVVLRELGELPIHGIAMRPSSPTGIGRIDQQLVFLLPGNPVSCLCAYDFFAGPAIRRSGGLPEGWPYPKQKLRLGRKLVSHVGRVDYCRVEVSQGLVTPMAVSGASNLASTSRAAGFVIIPANLEGYAESDYVEVMLYDDQFTDLQL